MQNLKQILAPQRTVSRAPGSSKKRLFETIAEIISRDQPALAYDLVLDRLTERENLGSTGLGQGIAIPHCRLAECPRPLGTLISLAEPVGFDAPDDQPVDLLFALLVPTEGHQEHLDILADIARRFSQGSFCQQLRAAPDDQALFEAAVNYTPPG